MSQLIEFKNLKELMAHLSDDQRCRDYAEQMRMNGNPVCPTVERQNPAN
jgi:hypothetical protein